MRETVSYQEASKNWELSMFAHEIEDNFLRSRCKETSLDPERRSPKSP